MDGIVDTTASSLWSFLCMDALICAQVVKSLGPFLWGFTQTITVVLICILLIEFVKYLIYSAVKEATSESLDKLVKYADKRLKILDKQEIGKTKRLLGVHTHDCCCSSCVT